MSAIRLLAELEFAPVLGPVSPQRLVDWAVQQMVVGQDTKSIVLLAGLPRYELNESKKLYLSCLEELGLALPDREGLRVHLVRSLARDIASGTMDPEAGSILISKLWSSASRSPSDAEEEINSLRYQLADPYHYGVSVPDVLRKIVEFARQLAEESEGEGRAT